MRTLSHPAVALLTALLALALAGVVAGTGQEQTPQVTPAEERAQEGSAPDEGAPVLDYAAQLELAAMTPALADRSRENAEAASAGCLSCHAGIEPIHRSAAVRLACVDCHGGDGSVTLAGSTPAGSAPSVDSEAYRLAKQRAHVQPRDPAAWPGSANPVRSYTLLNREFPAFVRFVNPGDLRVAPLTCGPCHVAEVEAVAKSPMTTSAIFWAAAGYANGILSTKRALLGESYSADGAAQAIQQQRPLTPRELAQGALTGLLPLPRWETTQPGEYFRAFERGGIFQPSAFPEIGNPNKLDEAGRPDIRLSNRGPGTGLRISPALINLHKTRLNDPHLSFLGTNDHPGDFRSSGCSGCHLVYANDRDPEHSGDWAQFGHRGESASADATLPRSESGHPVRHQLTRAIPTSQCMSCHMHQPNSFLNTYLGYTMWDYETDGDALWPREQRYPTEGEKRASLEHNPEGAAVRGLWTDPDFLTGVSELNPQLEHTQFADYHGHGWIFRAVFSRDRQGRLLDAEGATVPFDDPDRFSKAVHLKDIHLEKGMHCVDCHFGNDVHGTGLLHGEYANAIEIECQDCHGGVDAYSDLRTSGPAAPPGGSDLRLGFTPSGQPRFEWRGGALYQRSMLDPELEWKVPQTRDTVTPGHPDYNERSAYAKTIRAGGDQRYHSWGLDAEGPLAHQESEMTCYSCHSSWVTSCFGCHLPQEANVQSPSLHYEGATSRQYASYNPQVIRTDTFMLGINAPGKGSKIAPIRSSSALVLSSTNLNRQRFYVQQPPISTPGYASQAFNPHVPHTVRSRETKACGDCHLTAANDNNAWMAQLLGFGTQFVSFVGRHAWVALGDHGLEAVAVTEWDEPQAVIGSYLHRLAYPDDYRAHLDRGLELETAHHHSGGGGAVRSLQLRGEYLFTAKGRGGFEVFDVANIDNKDASERIVTAPFSPLGQRTAVATRFATGVALPTTMPVAPYRDPNPDAANLERPMHPIYRYAFVSDREEGLILINVDTLTDREPRNNFLRRALTFNPDGLLDGAENLTVAGNWVYVVCARGLVILDFSDSFADPLAPAVPQVAAVVESIAGATAVDVQFRYLFVAGRDGLTTVDVTDPRRPRIAGRAGGFGPAASVYVARTYAYLATGARGIAIIDVENPERPVVDQLFDAGGRLADTRDVRVAATNASLFAYVADGHNGLAVVQLTAPDRVPGYLGFSPRPAPALIAHHATGGEALAISQGLDRDRAVDESGNQVAIFNRIGAGPLPRSRMRGLYLRGGEIYRVSPQPPPADAAADAAADTAAAGAAAAAPASHSHRSPEHRQPAPAHGGPEGSSP